MTEAYCVKCGEKREMEDPTEATADNGQRMLKDTCPECGTSLTRFVKSA